MKKRIFNKLITFIITLTLFFSFCEPIRVYASTIAGEDIISELKDVDLSVYENAGKVDVIYLSEKDFGTENYSLTLYVYNPSKTRIVKNSESNVVNLACEFDNNNKALNYANFRLKYISSLEDNSIYKFSIVDNNNTLKRCFSMQNFVTGVRCYNIAGVQLQFANEDKAIDYAIKDEYRYYISGDKELKVDVVETIEVELNSVWYRTESASEKYHQNQVNSVYFSVPSHYFEKGYVLNGVKCEWYEYKTKPIIVLENQEKYNVLKDYVGVDIGDYKNFIPTLTAGEGKRPIDAFYIYFYDWSYNISYDSYYPSDVSVSNPSTKLHYLFSTNAQPYSKFQVTSEKLKNAIYSYYSVFDKEFYYVGNRRISADLFESEVDAGRIMGKNEKTISLDNTFDLLNYKDTNTWWERFADYGFLGLFMENEPSRVNLSPIHVVDIANDFSDMTKVGYNLLMAERFVNDFYTYTLDKIKEPVPKTTCLLRFANTDYYSQPLDNDDGYIAQETVFLDFDVITLNFLDGDKEVVVPVVSSPIDVISDITPPVDYESWLKYAVLGLVLCVAGLCIYNLFKKNR